MTITNISSSAHSSFLAAQTNQPSAATNSSSDSPEPSSAYNLTPASGGALKDLIASLKKLFGKGDLIDDIMITTSVVYNTASSSLESLQKDLRTNAQDGQDMNDFGSALDQLDKYQEKQTGSGNSQVPLDVDALKQCPLLEKYLHDHCGLPSDYASGGGEIAQSQINDAVKQMFGENGHVASIIKKLGATPSGSFDVSSFTDSDGTLELSNDAMKQFAANQNDIHTAAALSTSVSNKLQAQLNMTTNNLSIIGTMGSSVVQKISQLLLTIMRS